VHSRQVRVDGDYPVRTAEYFHFVIGFERPNNNYSGALMAIFLILVGAICGLVAGFTFVSAQYVTGQAVAVGLGICGCVLFVGGAIIDAINKAHTTLALAATSANKYMHPNQKAASSNPVEEFQG